ncbi:MAG: cystathionine gamma-lyase [Pseudomonadota bacterium]
MSFSDIERRFADMLHRASEASSSGDLVQPPIVPASVYWQPGTPSGPHQYGRWSNPTWDALEEALGALEDAQTLAFPSGMAAIAAALTPHLRPGDRALLPSDGYGATRVLATEHLAAMGVEIVTAPTRDFASAAVRAGPYGADAERPFRLIFAETPSNPGLDVCDLAGLAAIAQAQGALLVVDNTTMTPLGQRPLDSGADIVVSADTKAIAGHSDVLAGHLSSRRPELIAAARGWRTAAGAILGPFEAFLVHRGLETLELRFERMCANAALIAERLAEHPKLLAVRYPGLPTDPSYRLAKVQMRRFGFLIGATFASEDAAERFIAGCRHLRPTTSFGGVHSSAERRARWGDAVPPGFVRLSIGCEPTEILWGSIQEALDAL